METIYRIQILDETDQIVYFDRIKSSYGIHRVITSCAGGKTYHSYSSAEIDASRVRKYYSADCIVEIIKLQ